MLTVARKKVVDSMDNVIFRRSMHAPVRIVPEDLPPIQQQGEYLPPIQQQSVDQPPLGADKRFCSYCGRAISARATFCSGCGMRVDD